MEGSGPDKKEQKITPPRGPGGNGGSGRNCQVWAVGGGKGGTGKSFVTSSLGITLASRGKRVILLDADLGGANLHTFLGVKRHQKTITDFFERQVPLDKLVVESGIPGLGLISGDLHTLDSDNVRYTQKLKLFRHIQALDADYILIDLGAGSHNNTLDTFLLADRKLVVIVPVKTSIENMYHFVKNVYFRQLKMSFGKTGMKDKVMHAWRNRRTHGIKNLRELIDYLMATSPAMSDFFEKELKGFRINIVLNQVKNYQDISIGNSVKSIFKKYLGVSALFTGYLDYDESIWRCINSGKPYVKAYPSSNCARKIERLTENILQGGEVRVLKQDVAARRV